MAIQAGFADVITLACNHRAFTINARPVFPARSIGRESFLAVLNGLFAHGVARWVEPITLALIGVVRLFTPLLGGPCLQRWLGRRQKLLVGDVPVAMVGAGQLRLRGLTE